MSAAAGAGAGAAIAASIAQAIKASGVLVRVEADDFITIVGRTQQPLVVVAPSGLFGSSFMYLTSYKGLGFYAKSKIRLQLPKDTELLEAKAHVGAGLSVSTGDAFTSAARTGAGLRTSGPEYRTRARRARPRA